MSVMMLMLTIVNTITGITGRPARSAKKIVISIIVIASAWPSVGHHRPRRALALLRSGMRTLRLARGGGRASTLGGGSRAEPRQLNDHLPPTTKRLRMRVAAFDLPFKLGGLPTPTQDAGILDVTVGPHARRRRKASLTKLAAAIANSIRPGGTREARLRPPPALGAVPKPRVALLTAYKVAKPMITIVVISLSESVRPSLRSRQIGAARLGALAAARLRIKTVGT